MLKRLVYTTPLGRRSETYTVPSFELTGAGTAKVSNLMDFRLVVCLKLWKDTTNYNDFGKSALLPEFGKHNVC